MNSYSEQIAVGECPNCGFITGDDVRLPACTCERCHSTLDRATVAEKSEVKARAQ